MEIVVEQSSVIASQLPNRMDVAVPIVVIAAEQMAFDESLTIALPDQIILLVVPLPLPVEIAARVVKL